MSITDAETEKQIITGLIVSNEFCKQIVPILKTNPDYVSIPF